MSQRIRRLAGAVALALPPLLATCKSAEAPKVATTIVVTPSPVVLGAVGSSQQLAAVVKDQSGTVMTGQVVTWSGGSAAVGVSPGGLVTALANGIGIVTATSGSASQKDTVTVAQVGASITALSGNGQTATVGQALALPLVVQVFDSTLHAIRGTSVSFAVVSGGGAVGTPAATTDATGTAQTTWTLGTVAGTQTVTATPAGMTGAPLLFTATANAGAAASVAVQAGNHQRGVTGTAVTVRPAVLVKDAFNNATPGVTVTFAAVGGGGSVTGPAQVTNASGIATVGRWTLGAAGPDTVTATVAGGGVGGNPVLFVDTAYTLGAPNKVAALAGNNAVGLAGWGVNVRPAVVVTDANNFVVPGATVTFAVSTGGGSGTGLVVSTNPQGIAQVGSWVLGGAGLNTMTATVTGSGIGGNPVTFTDTSFTAGFQISVRSFGPPMPPEAKAAFDSAVAKWQRIIYRPLNPVSLKVPANACLPGTPADTEVTSGLVIYAAVDSIDGPGKVLGQAGPCYLRADSLNLSAYGVMEFDSADVRSLINNGTLNAVILHEMGHVLGFGTLWGPPSAGFIQANCLQLETTLPSQIQDTYFSCPKAQAAFDSVGGTSYTGGGSSPPRGNIVPVENCGTSPYISPTCGAGTVNSHWREVVMDNELMTGFLNNGANPLSIVTVAAQEDIGYVVNYAAADPYVHTFTAPPAAGAVRVELGDDIRHGPMYVVDANGVVLRVINPR